MPSDRRPVDAGIQLGASLSLSWNDRMLAVMGPGSSKTTALAVPAILTAPGAALVTSDRADTWATTQAARARTGHVWTFDPQAVTNAGQDWWWNPLDAIDSEDDATRMAAHFVRPTSETHAAGSLLAGLFLAAATGSGIEDVPAWLADPGDETPVKLLFQHGHPNAAHALRSLQEGPRDERDVVYEAVRTATECLLDPNVMAWVSQPPNSTMDRFDPDEFPPSTDTLYVLSRAGAGVADPLAATLTAQVLRSGVRRAEVRADRLDPPLVCVLDDAAVSHVTDLPNLYGRFAGRGIVPITILRSYRQGTTVWGDQGMDTLWAAATIKLVDSGLTEDLSALVGEHDTSELAVKHRRIGFRRRRNTGSDSLDTPGPDAAILLAPGAPPTMVRLNPWSRWFSAPVLATATAVAAAQIRDAGERERLISELAAEGIRLPQAPVPPVLQRRARLRREHPT
jgi:type IV secretory pathway TraG/TraD family ATPase VirD4